MKKTVRKRIGLKVERVRVLAKDLEKPQGGCRTPGTIDQTEGLTRASMRTACTQLTQ